MIKYKYCKTMVRGSDFNEIFFASEKVSDVLKEERQMELFKSAL